MRRWKGTLLCLALLLSLTACGGKGEGEGGSLLGQAAGMDEEKTLLTVDGREVALWQCLYWLDRACGGLEEQYAQAGKTLDWSAAVEEGVSLKDYVKEQALGDAALYATVDNWAQLYGVELGEEQTQQIQQQWALQSQQAGGEEAWLAQLAAQGLDQSRWEALEQTGQRYALLYDAFCAGQGDLAAAEGAVEAYADQKGYVTVQAVRLPEGEDPQAAQEKAAALFSQLNGAQDLAAAFQAVAAQGESLGTLTVSPEEGTLPQAVAEAVAQLEPGQYSGVIEAEGAYWLMMRLSTDLTVPRAAYFDDMLTQAAQSAPVETEPEWADVDPEAFSTALQALRQEEA